MLAFTSTCPCLFTSAWHLPHPPAARGIHSARGLVLGAAHVLAGAVHAAPHPVRPLQPHLLLCVALAAEACRYDSFYCCPLPRLLLGGHCMCRLRCRGAGSRCTLLFSATLALPSSHLLSVTPLAATPVPLHCPPPLSPSPSRHSAGAGVCCSGRLAGGPAGRFQDCLGEQLIDKSAAQFA